MELYLSTNYVLKISAQIWSFKSVQKVLIFQFFFSVSAFGTEIQCQSFLQCLKVGYVVGVVKRKRQSCMIRYKIGLERT